MISFGWKNNAGLIRIDCGRWDVHLFVQRSHWKWGMGWDELAKLANVYLWYCGGGPFFLVAYCPYP